MLTPAVKGLRAQCLGFLCLVCIRCSSPRTERRTSAWLHLPQQAGALLREGDVGLGPGQALWEGCGRASQPASSPALGSCFSVLKSCTAYCASPAC